jgi:hypothetical protein
MYRTGHYNSTQAAVFHASFVQFCPLVQSARAIVQAK